MMYVYIDLLNNLSSWPSESTRDYCLARKRTEQWWWQRQYFLTTSIVVFQYTVTVSWPLTSLWKKKCCLNAVESASRCFSPREAASFEQAVSEPGFSFSEGNKRKMLNHSAAFHSWSASNCSSFRIQKQTRDMSFSTQDNHILLHFEKAVCTCMAYCNVPLKAYMYFKQTYNTYKYSWFLHMENFN